MKKRNLILVLFFLTLKNAVLFSNNAEQISPPALYVITNVNVIPMNKELVLKNQKVVVENGKIKQIGEHDKVKTPVGAIIIDGKDKYLIPGLFDMHAHFFQEQYEDHKSTSETELKMMLANGMTSVRIMAGHPDYLEARKKIKNGQWIGPSLTIASPQLVGAWPWPPEFKNYEIVDTKEKAIDAVKKFKDEGYDAIKITFMVDRIAYDAIMSTAKEVGIKVVGHVGPKVKLPAALQAGEQIEHMDEFIDMLLPDTSYNHGQTVSDMNIWRKPAWATVPYLDESKIPALAKMVKDADVYVSPTNYFFISTFGQIPTEEEIKNKPDYEYIPESLIKEKWSNREHYINMGIPAESREKYIRIRKQMVNALWKAGVPLMAGSDSPEFFLVTGFSLHDELATFVDAGLTPFAALQTATKIPAEFLGLKSKGTIEKEKDADLILLDKNPLDDIANTKAINSVFKNGILYDRKALDAMLQEAKGKGK